MAAAIGGLAAKAGHTVEIMSRASTKARALAEQIGANATTGTFGTAPAGDIIILAVPYSAVLDVVKLYGEGLAGKLLVDITNPIKSDFTGFLTLLTVSALKRLPKVPPPTRLSSKPSTLKIPMSWPLAQSKAAHWTYSSQATTQRQKHASPRSSIVLDCPMDAGQLTMAWALEHACMLVLGLVTHSIKHTNFSIGVSLPG